MDAADAGLAAPSSRSALTGLAYLGVRYEYGTSKYHSLRS